MVISSSASVRRSRPRAFRASSSAVTSSSRLHSMTSRPSLTSARPTKMVSVSHSTRMEGSPRPPRRPHWKPRRLRRSQHVQAAHRSWVRPVPQIWLVGPPVQDRRQMALEQDRRQMALERTAQTGRNLSRQLIRTTAQLLQARRPRVHRTALRNLLPIPVTETPARALLLQKPAPLPPPLLLNQPQKLINHTARSRA